MAYNDVTDNVVATSAFSMKTLEPVPAHTVMMTCITLPDEIVFVDCGLFPELASKFRRDMEKRFQRKTSYLLLTHTHWDHCLAMEAFADTKIVASPKETARFKRLLKSEPYRKRWVKNFKDDKEITDVIKNVRLCLPNVVSVEEKLVIGPKGQEITFQVTGGHSPGSAYVYSPAERVLCAGDNLLTCYAQLIGDGEKTLEIYRHWETLSIEQVIPGHGKIVKKKYIAKVRSYFEELITVLEELRAEQLNLRSVLKHPRLPTYFGEHQASWVEGSRYHTDWLNFGIKYWYKKLSHT